MSLLTKVKAPGYLIFTRWRAGRGVPASLPIFELAFEGTTSLLKGERVYRISLLHERSIDLSASSDDSVIPTWRVKDPWRMSNDGEVLCSWRTGGGK